MTVTNDSSDIHFVVVQHVINLIKLRTLILSGNCSSSSCFRNLHINKVKLGETALVEG